MATRNRPADYESAIDEAIATCGGDVHGALKALLAANEHLEAELARLRAITPERSPVGIASAPPHSYLN
jgi:hypothetical protein